MCTKVAVIILAPTLIIKCFTCAGLFLAGNTQKTKRCPYCGKCINLQKAVRVAQVANSLEASELLKQLKIKNANNPRSKL
ncbi:MAG: DUF1922 domain-containing protein [Nitrososphaerota archaeon]|uniref:DUF1922 domain-containing protein n=1 Tax=Candidatus Bathycorpusculum sp. TaxID=2994959 RepID=UPI0028171CB8|nr:DUF1922 domain-containing protein [Candidatus Termiticorpusculum sp.]MCL2257609.1 DUF1922 domain-containing protein [Candidatus Termiticorpusculum sp.]MDR0461028.1 DUF1922 domain-containing protein [Nitrososphaerota archaeon]